MQESQTGKMANPLVSRSCWLMITVWMMLSLTAFHSNGYPICKDQIDCVNYKAPMSVWNSSRPEKVLMLTNNQTHMLAMKDVHEHPISLQNLFDDVPIKQNMKVYYYRTFSGRNLTVNDRGHLTIEPTNASEAAKFVRYRYRHNRTADVYLMCAFVFNKTTNKNFSFLISPFRCAVKLNDTSCHSEAQFAPVALDIINQGFVDRDRPLLKQEDYQFLHVHVNDPLTAYSYLSEELRSLCVDGSEDP